MTEVSQSVGPSSALGGDRPCVSRSSGCGAKLNAFIPCKDFNVPGWHPNIIWPPFYRSEGGGAVSGKCKCLTPDLQTSHGAWSPNSLLWPDSWLPGTLGPLCPCRLIGCDFPLITVEWSILSSLEFCWMKSRCFYRVELVPWRGDLSAARLLNLGHGWPPADMPPRVTLSGRGGGVGTCLARALGELSEVTYLKQLVLPK